MNNEEIDRIKAKIVRLVGFDDRALARCTHDERNRESACMALSGSQFSTQGGHPEDLKGEA